MIAIKETDSKEFLVKSKLPGSDYVFNPYVGCTHKCVYCYACFMKKFTNHDEKWGEFIDIKNYSNYKLPKDIDNKYIFISSVTDPYNHFEKKYLKTRKTLELLKDINCHIGILTKSKLVLRDVDLFKQFKNIEIGISMNTIDDTFRSLVEPFASSVSERIDTLKKLKSEGLRTYVFMSPIFPYITDFKDIIEKTKPYVDHYGFENLNLRADYKYEVLNLIKEHYPHLYSLYRDIYINNNLSYWSKLESEIRSYCKDNNIDGRIYFHHDKIRKD